MRGHKQIALALSLLLLAGCSAGQTPSPSATERAFSDLSKEVMAHVEDLLAGEPHLWQQLPNGSGPNGVSLSGYEEEIKALFSGREWTAREKNGETASVSEEPWQWDPSIQLYGYDSPGNTIISFGEDYIYVRTSGGQNGVEAHYYAAEDAASLPQELFDLYDGPNLRYAMAGVPASEAADFPQAMPLFAQRFEQLYLESGAITDLELTALEPVPGSKNSLYMTYAVRPADPDAPCWEGLEISEDGRIHLSHQISLYLYEDDQWHMDHMSEVRPAAAEVLSYVDQVLSADKVTLRCWLSNGSGPCPLSMEDYKERVRSIFAGYEWKPLEEPLPSPEWTPEQWSIQLLNDDMNVCLSVSSAQDQLTISFSGNDSESKFYTAEGAADLCVRLADLHPGPEARLLLTTVPAESVSNDEDLAAAYAAAFEEMYLTSGHIADFKLHSVKPLPSDPPDSIYRHIRMDFSVTPADPEDPWWGRNYLGDDGRFHLGFDVSLLLYENGNWRGDWLQSQDQPG